MCDNCIHVQNMFADHRRNLSYRRLITTAVAFRFVLTLYSIRFIPFECEDKPCPNIKLVGLNLNKYGAMDSWLRFSDHVLITVQSSHLLVWKSRQVVSSSPRRKPCIDHTAPSTQYNSLKDVFTGVANKRPCLQNRPLTICSDDINN